MPKVTNQQLVNTLYAATYEDRIDWQPTGEPAAFTASFGGKWTLVFHRRLASDGGYVTLLELQDTEGQVILVITSFDDERLPEIYELARRHALKIDEALADLLKEIDKPQG